MKNAIYGFLYIVILSYALVICAELSNGIFFHGIKHKLVYLPYLDLITKANIYELFYIINRTNIFDVNSFKILAGVVGISFVVGISLSRYLIKFDDRALN